MAVKKRSPRVNWRQAAIALAKYTLFALNHHKHLGRGTGQMIDLKTMKPLGPWQEQFFDALALIGFEADRAKYYRDHYKRSRR